MKFNPPLDVGTIAFTEDHKSVIVGVGNRGFGDVKILEVTVNNEENPLETKIQVSDSLQGFILLEDFTREEAQEYHFTNIADVVIKQERHLLLILKKLDEGTVTEDDEIYGISIIHTGEIANVHLEYSHFGMEI
ncbi:hypothetical protein [Oceanobacillus alkalisoli]|uniref:hypothetical protein n=1 Tax=Oceanobacillus alkalisoli TaxID=2925113 RepID=UPI001EE4299C|nr:hypothetical protein [Oceanobacillus alkalisoli]MCG5104798.1 hypothetical protein [Oceanobacillus alkalisoli]